MYPNAQRRGSLVIQIVSFQCPATVHTNQVNRVFGRTIGLWWYDKIFAKILRSDVFAKGVVSGPSINPRLAVDHSIQSCVNRIYFDENRDRFVEIPSNFYRNSNLVPSLQALHILDKIIIIIIIVYYCAKGAVRIGNIWYLARRSKRYHLRDPACQLRVLLGHNIQVACWNGDRIYHMRRSCRYI